MPVGLEMKVSPHYHAVSRMAAVSVVCRSSRRNGIFTAMPSIKFVKEKRTIEVPEGANLRQAARQEGVEVYPGLHKTFNCQGMGMCCSCRMQIKKGAENVSKQGFWEKLNLLNPLNPFGFFSSLDDESEIRLSCQTKVLGDVEVETKPEFNWHGKKFWG
jgi:ferredoxin